MYKTLSITLILDIFDKIFRREDGMSKAKNYERNVRMYIISRGETTKKNVSCLSISTLKTLSLKIDAKLGKFEEKILILLDVVSMPVFFFSWTRY